MIECKMDEYWIARVQYWPEGEIKVDVVLIAYAWKDGTIDVAPEFLYEKGIPVE